MKIAIIKRIHTKCLQLMIMAIATNLFITTPKLAAAAAAPKYFYISDQAETELCSPKIIIEDAKNNIKKVDHGNKRYKFPDSSLSSIQCIDFNNSDLVQLVELLKNHNIILKKIDLSKSSINDITPLITSCPDLEEINLSQAPKIFINDILSLAQNCPKLKYINICFSFYIGDEEAKILRLNYPHIRIYYVPQDER